MSPTRQLRPLHSPEVQDVLASAGLSRRAELGPERIARAEQLASGQVQYETEAGRRTFIMEGPKPSTQGGAIMASNGTPRTRGADPKSARRKILAKSVQAILGAEASEEPKHDAVQLTRKELDKQVRKPKDAGATSVASWVGEACSQEIVVEVDGKGYKFVRAGRGLYGLEEVDLPEPEPQEPEAAAAE